MKLYHGSKLIIDCPTTCGSKPSNDYGSAFYCTRDLESACEWAARNNSIGYVNAYEFDIDGLKVLDLTDKPVLHWLAILLHFRILDQGFIRAFNHRLKFIEENYYIDANEYDLVIGHRGDDAYFRFPLEFVRGNLALEQLEYSFKLGELGIQYAIISDEGIKRLSYLNSFLVSDSYIDKYFDNVTRASRDFDRLDKDEEGIRILDLMRMKR